MNITVYCGAHYGKNTEFNDMAVELGTWMGKAGHDLVYGAGKVGLMGSVANAVMANGGRAIGVTPNFFIEGEETHEALTELKLVHSMSERRDTMMELADAFIALPGGMGTLDEIGEVMACKRLKLHDKPIFIININGYYDNLIAFMKDMIEADLYSLKDFNEVHFVTTIEEIEQVLKDVDTQKFVK